MDCKHRKLYTAVYIQVQLFVYFNKSMTKYCIVKKFKNQKNATFKCVLLFIFNPIKAGDLNLCIDWGASHAPPPLEKALANRYRVLIQVHSQMFQGQLFEITLD